MAGAAVAPASGGLEWLNKSVLQRIGITGRRTLGFHQHTVQGDKEAFESLTYFGQGSKRFTDTGQMTLVGNKVLGFINFNLQIADDRYDDPQSQRIWLEYERNGLQLGYGDLTSVNLLNTNEFASYSKTLSGATVGYRSGRLAFKAVRTETKTSARTRSFEGANTVGPYFIGDGQIIDGSEQVRVDGQEMHAGKDYTINYQIGSITFVERVISPTSTIVVSYETLGFNSSSGTVEGAGLSYDMGKAGKIGFTAMQQKSAGSVGLSTRTHRSQGFPAATPYYLPAIPLDSKPIIVKVNGLIQLENVHYVFERDSNNQPVKSIIYMLRDIPPSQTVEITYTPRPLEGSDGDRRVIGFDYTLPLDGNKGKLSYSQATGELVNGTTPRKGTARGIRADYNLGNGKIWANWRNVPSSFTTVESRGFNRNEKATELGAEFRSHGLRYGLTSTNSAVANRSSDSLGNLTFNNSRYTNQRFFVSKESQDLQKVVGWSLTHNRTASRYSGNDTKIDTTTLSAKKNFGRLRSSLDFERQDGAGPINKNGVLTDGDISLNTIRLTADYNFDNGLALAGRGSLSQVSALGERGNGRDIQLTADYRPKSGPFDFQASYISSDSGQVATLAGFQSGYGFGYGGNGFSGGGLGGPFGNTLGASGTKYELLQLTPNYKINDRTHLSGRFYKTKSAGAYNSNTETQAYGIGLQMDLGNQTALSFSADQMDTRFIGIGSRSKSTSYQLFVASDPAGPWAYRFGINGLASGANSTYAQDSFGIDGGVTYWINPRQNVKFEFVSGRTSGFFPQSEQSFGFAYEYQIFRNISLIGSYRWRDVKNLSSDIVSGAYRSSGFDLELNFNFGG